MKVRFTRRAFADREAIFDYLHQRSPAGAGNVMARFRHAVEQLSSQPFIGIETDHEDVRVLFVGRYPFKLFYRVRDGTIEILHIRHTSRRPADLD
jgi:addiction module RelE/StbE family toxin